MVHYMVRERVMTFNPKFPLLLLAAVLIYWLGVPLMYSPIQAIDAPEITIEDVSK